MLCDLRWQNSPAFWVLGHAASEPLDGQFHRFIHWRAPRGAQIRAVLDGRTGKQRDFAASAAYNDKVCH